MPALSFRHKVLLLLIVCLCVSQTSTMLATLATTERSVRSSVRQELEAARTQFNQLFLRRYGSLRELGQNLGADPAFVAATASPARLQVLLENALVRSGATHALYMAPDGRILAAAGPSDLSAATAGLHTGNFALQVMNVDNRLFQLVALPLAAFEGGTLILGMELDEGLAQEFRSSTGLHVSLFDLGNKQHPDIVSTLPGAVKWQLVAALQNFGLLYTGAPDLDLELGSAQWLGSTHVLQGGDKRLFAIIQKSLDAEMQPYYRVKENLLALLVQVMFVAVLGSIYIGSNIVKPIRQLANLAARIGEGNYNTSIPAMGNDEIGRLGASINTMQREIAKRERQILFQAQHDELTGLPNRYLVRDRIQGAIARAMRGRHSFVVIMLDIARFKQINDTLGHDTGDVVLRETALRLRDNLRRADTLARLGSDDFMIVQEQADLAAALDKIEGCLLPALAVPYRVGDSEMCVKCRFGLVAYPAHGEDAETLLRRAEIALFEAKGAPHAIAAVYEPGSDESHRREFTIVSDLEQALASGAIRLHYQPKVNLRTGKATQAEALVRWEHPALGTLRPDEFIGVLERTGNINRLTHWIVGEACRQIRAWRDTGLDLRISVNLSALDLLDASLLAVVASGIETYGVPSANLVFEITESAVMQNPEASLALLAALKDSGFRLALDDYGTGYSSLAQIKNLPVSELKIDQSFVRELDRDGQDLIIVRSTIELAHSMGLKVVAEGVESEAALHLLRQMDCDEGQGYFFCKPLDAAAVEAWLRARQTQPIAA